MENIKLVALDIDGTLVNDLKQFPDNFNEIVDKLLANDIAIMICSGRSIKTLLRDFNDYKDKFYFAAENGAIVYYQGNTNIIGYLDDDTSKIVLDHLEELRKEDKDINYVISCLDNGYIMDRGDDTFYNTLKPYYVMKCINRFEDIKSKVIKIAGYSPNNSKGRIEDKSLDLNKYCDVVVSGEQWCDFDAKGINKGTAIKEVLKTLNITKDEACAFGDQNNDIDMLKEVKYSCAMKNGTDELKAIASYITDEDNNHNGALKYLLKLLDM